MIDTHSHIYGPEYDEDRADVVARAKSVGVAKLLLANVDLTTIEPMRKMAQEYPDFTDCAMGLHPTEIRETWRDDLAIIKSELYTNFSSQPPVETERAPSLHRNSFSDYKTEHAPSLPNIHPNYCAIGEIGIDLYWDKTYVEEQKLALAEQMRWALELDLPVILHIRKGHAEVFETLKTLGANRYKGVFHCFGGGIEEAKKAVSLGFMLGIGGTLTYKKSTIPAIVREIGLDHILTETDAPYLPPVPHRGERNEPAFMAEVVNFLATVFDENASLIDEITTQNARNTFNI